MLADDRGQAQRGVKGVVACLVPVLRALLSPGAQPQVDAWRKFLCLKTFDSQGTAAFVIAGAARTAAGTLIVDPWSDCCLKRVGRGEA